MRQAQEFAHIPVIDVSGLAGSAADRQAVAARLGEACRESGFFYAVGHDVDEGLQHRLRELSRQFFSQDLEAKLRIRMALGGRAWRGYFRVGDELTSGKPDQKEGLYFGAELPTDHPRVHDGTPLHGRNLFPAEPPGLRESVLEYMAALRGRLETGVCSRWADGYPVGHGRTEALPQ
jgi:isopenicillin N synthase-like dioxygenase